MRGFLCLLNVRFWPLGDTQIPDCAASRMTAFDPKLPLAIRLITTRAVQVEDYASGPEKRFLNTPVVLGSKLARSV